MRTLLLFLVTVLLATSPVFATDYHIDESYGQIPVTFVPNAGQFDSSFVFAVEGNNSDSLYSLSNATLLMFADDDHIRSIHGPTPLADEKLYLQLYGANYHPAVTYENPAGWNNNYFIGNDPAAWHTDIPNYRTVRLNDVYPGIDFLLESNGRAIDVSLVVHPGVNPDQIQLRARARDSEVDVNGNYDCLLYNYNHYPEYWHSITPPPPCFQSVDGATLSVDSRYRQIVKNDSLNIIGLTLGAYDTTRDLIVRFDMADSPLWLLKYVTEIAGLVVDDEGCVYTAGKGYYVYNRYKLDTLLAYKVNEAADTFGYVTHYGGINNINSISSAAVERAGNFIIAGVTSGSSFPTVESSYKYLGSGTSNSFMIKLSEQGNNILYSVFFGRGTIKDIEIDSDGNTFMVGQAVKEIPVTNGSFSPPYLQGFLAKFNTTGTELIFSTLFGGSGNEYPLRIVLDNDNHSYICGYTESGDFPATNLLASNLITYNSNAFIAKFDPYGSNLLSSVLIGGTANDYAIDLLIDNSGDIVITGSTSSPDYPITNRIPSNMIIDGEVIYLSKFTSDLSDLLFSTVVESDGTGIGIKKYGNNYLLLGNVKQSTTYPTTPDALFQNPIGGRDLVLSIIDRDGYSLLYSSYFGTSDDDVVNPINYGTVYYDNKVYIAGFSFLPEVPIRNNMFDSYGRIDSPDPLYILHQYFIRSVLIESYDYVDKNNIVKNELLVYPNPFNNKCNVEYYISMSSEISIRVYNLIGQCVYSYDHDTQLPGNYTVSLETSKYSSGLYIFQLKTGDSVISRKAILLK